MWRDAVEREEKLFFRKSENRKSENQMIAIKKNTNFSGNFAPAKSKDVASLSIRFVLSKKSGRTSYRNPRQLPNLRRSPLHLPVDASSFNEEIEPLVAGRTNLLKKVRCGLNLEQR
jgi:hypothetical protein